jgi:hypothetical protein
MDREMQRALLADGEKLAQLTGADHGPYFFPEDATRIELLDLLEQAEDEYQEVAKALGCTRFFHKDVMARARELARAERVA